VLALDWRQHGVRVTLRYTLFMLALLL